MVPGRGCAGKEVGYGHIGVALSRIKPLLQALPTVPVLRARLEGVTPNLLTQVNRGGEVMGERVAEGLCRAEVLACGGMEAQP